MGQNKCFYHFFHIAEREESKNSDILSVENKKCRLQFYRSCFELSFYKVTEISKDGDISQPLKWEVMNDAHRGLRNQGHRDFGRLLDDGV